MQQLKLLQGLGNLLRAQILYEHCTTVVHMTRIIVRECLSLSKLPALVAFSCSCSYSMCTVLPIAGCHKGLF